MGAPQKPYRSKAQEQEFLAMLHFSQSNPKPEKNLPTLSTHIKPHVHELQHRDILVHNEVDQVTSGSKHMEHAPSSESTYKKKRFHELQKRCLHTTWQKRNTRRYCHMDSR
jgi:hypothetical protein